MVPSQDPEKFYKKYISLTEWLDGIGHDNVEALRVEDNEKRERLKVLNEVIGLPYDMPYQFSATEVANRPKEFRDFVDAHGEELTNIRLIPLVRGLPKIRMRGKSIREALEWFDRQSIDPSQYRVDFIPHPRTTAWGTIFVVNRHGIFGEITRGSHTQLTQGYQEAGPPIGFSYDFQKLRLSDEDAEARSQVDAALSYLKVGDVEVQRRIESQLNAQFSHDYLEGYFETTESDDFGLLYVDYNRILGIAYADYTGPVADTGHLDLVKGQIGCAGKAVGRVRVVLDANDTSFETGEILVCKMTTPDFLPIMQKAGAIVTDVGGILSHAAIVPRELKKPCLAGTGDATKRLATGQLVEVDADAGVVRPQVAS